jgi:glycerol uptake facilitator-like aquaporin
MGVHAWNFGVVLGGLSLQVESDARTVQKQWMMIAWAWGYSTIINILTTNQAPNQPPPNKEEV